ncbi:hypothetical protein YC2023_106876 [Brassica napus]
MRQGGLYTLTNFYGSRNKEVFRVAAHSMTISFSHSSELAPLENSLMDLEEDRFQFHSYEDFEAGCDMKGDLFDVIGPLKLVSGQSLNMSPFIDDSELATTRRILHYLWDQAAVDFCKKFKSSDNTPSIILVTTVYPKRLGGRTRVITVTKVLSPSAPPSTQDPVADQISGSGNGTLATGDDVIEPSKSPQDSAEVWLKRMGDGVEIGNAKRSKDGN